MKRNNTFLCKLGICCSIGYYKNFISGGFEEFSYNKVFVNWKDLK